MKIIKKKLKRNTKAKTNQLAVAKTKIAKHTPAYYHCLANKAKHGLKSGVANCCKSCKEQSGQLALSRQQEIKKLGEAYRQIGTSLSKLLANG